jgi:hypothetical protein
MPSIFKINVGGQELSAIERDFEIQREEWNAYKLLDGGTVRVKTTAKRICQVVDENGNPAYNADGTPFMVVYHDSTVVSRL